jgi:hypothetical protein
VCIAVVSSWRGYLEGSVFSRLRRVSERGPGFLGRDRRNMQDKVGHLTQNLSLGGVCHPLCLLDLLGQWSEPSNRVSVQYIAIYC